ncbi:hypothetical protein [Actinotalea fermentans]|uniref:Uncharacterized protein n=1 Tax=Actinotalea fermentans TaxID=43671 RepID=A0A511Z0T1_9CELL|nr:hypothetical protein [Actinotalea fermentans]KGM15247.1 hypothetical protein N867_10495 [Actinotalea fermentans ATCC 43279 = JCM 9966 = DSM 3133]GEN81058.1 hypothetical protein AFE02nite_27920 [Actinotalea fermentans]
MSEHVPAPWPVSVPRPTVALAVAGPAEAALGALRHAVEAEGYRITSSAGPAGFEASRTSWKDLLGGSLPQRGLVVAGVTPGPDRTVLRVGFPTGGNDWGARQRAVRVLSATVGALRSAGIAVDVGEWESGLPAR